MLLGLLALRAGAEQNRDFYEILGLRHDCTDKEINTAFQRLSRQYHPDHNKGNKDAARKYGDINDAYAALSDPNKRRVFDLWGEPGVHLADGPAHLEMAGMFGMGSDDPTSAGAIVRRKGAEITLQFPVDLKDYFVSQRYQLSVARQTMCRCPGPGFMCAKCGGHPTQRENNSQSVIFERGYEQGYDDIRLAGGGDMSAANAAGDIRAEVVTRPHPFYTRTGSDLHCRINVTLREALLGFTRKVPHVLDGREVTITSSGVLTDERTVRVRGEGLPVFLGLDGFGDVVAHVDVLMPKDAGMVKSVVTALRS
jgi:DnaJ-class molecular chaperone